VCPVYCESCIMVPEDEVIICSVCESPHPGQVLKVCLEFNNFLEEKFPEEYAVQRKNVEHKQLQFRPKSPSACMFCFSTYNLFFCCLLERILCCYHSTVYCSRNKAETNNNLEVDTLFCLEACFPVSFLCLWMCTG